MRFTSAAVALAAATSVSAWYNDTIVYTTEIVDVYTTVCPAGATITYGGHTYTNTLTESSTITITDCPCTISKPVYTATSVYCNTCSTPAPVYPTTNGTTPAPPAPTTAVGTTYVPAPTTSPVVPASGANKAFAMSGSLVGLLGLAAYLL